MRYEEKNLIVNVHWKGLWNITHKHEDEIYHEIKNNALMDEGESQILDVYFRGATPPTNLFFGLGNNGGTPGIPAETATLATITEVSGTGYARISLNRNTTDFPTLSLDSGDYQVVSITKQFAATGTWTAADYLFLCDVGSGTAGDLIATVALSASRSLVNSDTLDVSMTVKLQ